MKIKSVNIYNLYPAILGIRNSYKSKDKSDSLCKPFEIIQKSKSKNNLDLQKFMNDSENWFSFNHINIGLQDKKLIKKLLNNKNNPYYKAQERKFLRQILVSMDVVGSIKFWSQMDTFKISTVRNSESTMHCIATKIIEQKDFERPICPETLFFLNKVINAFINYNENDKLNFLRLEEIVKLLKLDKIFYNHGFIINKKYLFDILDANLPAGYILESHWTGNYENLRNIYHGRKTHKMYWWKEFCQYLEKFPYFELLIKGELDG